MGEILKLLSTDIRNLVRIRWLWFYLLALACGSALFLYMSGDLDRVILSLLNVTLLIVPLITAFFGITYFYDSKDFIKFLLTQPVSRREVFLGKFLSLSIFMSLLYFLGVSIPLGVEIVRSENRSLILLLLLSGVMLTVLFSSLAFLIGVLSEDKAKGVSLLLGVWLYLAVLHDGVVLAVIYLFKEYPLEKVVLALTLINPVDLARLLVILNLDIAALMGVSGAVVKDFFGSALGAFVVFASMTLWVAIPSLSALILFERKDL